MTTLLITATTGGKIWRTAAAICTFQWTVLYCIVLYCIVLYCTGLNASHYQQWLLDDSTTVTRHIPISSAALVFPTCHLTDANHQHNKQNKQIATNKSTCLNHIYYAEYKSRRIVYLQALYNSNSPTQTTTSGRDRPSQYVTIIIRMWQTDSVAETVAMNAAEKLVYRVAQKNEATLFNCPNL